MPKKYVFTLLSQTLPRRNQSTIRRALSALGATVHIATPNTENLPSDTTHLLLTEQVACAAFVISVASAADVLLVTPAFANDCAKYETLTPPFSKSHQPPHDSNPDAMLPAAEKALWIGRPWSGAYHFWRARADAGKQRPLYGHRVVVVGQLRPRGAARLLAPSSRIVKDILSAAGAAVIGESESNPTFAIVAPGLNRNNSSDVARFLDDDVLCLSSAFLVDLIIRVSANPCDYVLFTSQKSLCGSRLDHSSIPTHNAPLPVILRPIPLPAAKPDPNPVIIDLCSDPSSSSKSQRIKAADPTACSNSGTPQLGLIEGNSLDEKSPVVDNLQLSVPTPPHPPSPLRHVTLKHASQAKRINLNTPTEKKKFKPFSPVLQDNTQTETVCHSRSEGQMYNSKCLTTTNEVLHEDLEVLEDTNIEKPETVYSSTATTKKPTSPKANASTDVSLNPSRTFLRSSPRFSKSQTMDPDVTTVVAMNETAHNGQTQEQDAPADSLSIGSSEYGAPVNHLAFSRKNDSEACQKTETRSLPYACSQAKLYENPACSVHTPQSQALQTSQPFVQSDVKVRAVPARIRLRPPKRNSGNNSIQVHHKNMYHKKRPRRTVTESPRQRERVVRRVSDSSDVNGSQDGTDKESAHTWGSRNRKPPSTAPHSPKSFDSGQNRNPLRLIDERIVKPKHCVSETYNDLHTDTRNPHLPIEIDSDSDSGNILERPVSKTQCDTRAAEETRLIREGYEFILSTVGGEASENSVKRILRSIDAPKVFWEDIHDEAEKSKGFPTVQDDDCAESPFLDDDNENEVADNINHDRYLPSQRDILTNDNLFRQECSQAGGDGSRSNLRRGADTSSRSTGNNMQPLTVPKRPIVLSNVARSELVFMNNANCLNVADGNSNDDQSCQGIISFGEWLLAAENLVGFTLLDETVLTECGRTSTIRRLWASLFESTIFEKLSSPGGLSEAQTYTLAGICIRLLYNEPQLDMGSRLARELLKVQEKQKLIGSDSLHIVLCARNIVDVSIRHKAIVGIWSALLHAFSLNKNESNTLHFYQEIMKSGIDDIFECLTAPEKVKRPTIESKIVSFMDTFRLVLFTSAVKLDIFEAQSNMEVDDSEKLIPENWSVICSIFERFAKETKLSRNVSSPKDFLVALLEYVTRNFCGIIWTVTESVLLSMSRAVAAICKIEKRSCFCDQNPLHTASFDVLGKTDSTKDTHELLRTPCDHLFYTGWQFVADGDGNGMKRMMTVLRSAALFCNSDDNETRRVVWHHVGSVLSIASFISQHAGGEDHVLNLLTTKGLDLISMLKQTDAATGSNIETWEILYRAMVTRCKCVVKQHGNIHVYVNWLCEGIIECMGLMHRIAKRRTIGVGEREILRVQEGLVRTVLLRRTCTLRDIMDLVWRQIDEQGTHSDVISKCVATTIEPGVKFFAFCRESVSQMRMNCEQSSGECRDLLICEVLGVLESFMKLLAHLCGDTTRDFEGVIGEFARRYGPYNMIINDENEGMVIDMIGGQDLIRDEECSTRAKKSSSVILALMIELRGLTYEPGWSGENCEKLVALLRKCKLDILSKECSTITGFYRGTGTFGREVQGLDDRSMVRFWWWGVRSKWATSLIEQNQDVKGIVLGMIAWIMVYEGTAGANEIHLIMEMKQALRSWSTVNEFIQDWADVNNDSAVEADLNDRMSQSVEKIVMSLGEQWGRLQSRRLIGQLRTGVMGLVRCKRKGIALDGLSLLSILFKIESDARGFCNGHGARWMLPWITDICDSLQWIGHASGAWRNGPQWSTACEQVQRCIMGGLSMVAGDGRDAELRMLVLRLFNGMDVSDNLSGVWDAPAHVQRIRFADDNHGETEAIKRKVQRNLDEWRTYAFRSVVDDPLTRHLTGGKSITFPLQRLLSAARHAATMLTVDGRPDTIGSLTLVVERIRSSNFINVIERDVTSRMLWRQVCASVNLVRST